MPVSASRRGLVLTSSGDDMAYFLTVVLTAIFFYMVGYADCLSTYYKRAEKGTIFEAKGKVYRMVQVQIKDEDTDD